MEEFSDSLSKSIFWCWGGFCGYNVSPVPQNPLVPVLRAHGQRVRGQGWASGLWVTHLCPDLLLLGMRQQLWNCQLIPLPTVPDGRTVRNDGRAICFLTGYGASTGVGTNLALMMALSQQKFSRQRWPCLSCSVSVKLEFKAPLAAVLGLSRSNPKGCTGSSWYVWMGTNCLLIY